MTLTRREKGLAALTGVCLIVVALVLSNAVLPSARARAERIDELESKLETGRELSARKAELEDTWRQYQETATSLSADRSQAENTIVRFLHERADARGIVLTDLRPHWRKQKDMDDTVELRIAGEGKLAAMAGFILDVETDALPFRVESAEITCPKGDIERLRLQLALSVILMPESLLSRRRSVL